MLLSLIRSGRLILLTSGRLKAGSMSRLLLIYFPGKSWVGRLMITCGLRCALMLCKWHFGDENLSLAYNIILIEAANMQVTNIEDTWG